MVEGDIFKFLLHQTDLKMTETTKITNGFNSVYNHTVGIPQQNKKLSHFTTNFLSKYIDKVNSYTGCPKSIKTPKSLLNVRY